MFKKKYVLVPGICRKTKTNKKKTVTGWQGFTEDLCQISMSLQKAAGT